MARLEDLKAKVLEGEALGKAEALALVEAPLDPLCQAANAIRQHFCGRAFELCTIINAKSGRCSEDCRFCAQSACHKTGVETYPLLEAETIVQAAQNDAAHGARRFAMVTSGRRLTPAEVKAMASTLKRLRQETPLVLCASCGLLDGDDLAQLQAAGLTRYHNNLETSASFFGRVCTTHTSADKVATIRAAQALGLETCSGGILGLGESWEDRIEMALALRELGVSSIPLNFLNPIPHTPLADQPVITPDEAQRVFALFRFLNPRTFLRLAGGRSLLPDKGRACLQSGGNAMISGDMLTTKGFSLETDLKMIKELGFEVL